MDPATATANDVSFLPRSGLAALVTTLQGEGYTVIAPTRLDGIVSFRPIERAEEMVQGIRDEQQPGRYRLEDGDPHLQFEHVVGPSGAKPYFFPSAQPLYRIRVGDEGFATEELRPAAPRLAMLGLRPCDLAAIRIQDRIFGEESGQPPAPGEPETYYRSTRRQAVLIGVSCTRPGGTCFCVSMGSGPEAVDGFDVALTELKAGFLVRAGTERGRALLAGLPLREVSAAELELAEIKMERARASMGRRLDVQQAREVLAAAQDHPRWADVARRCMSCGSCTMVCPTCFCNTVVDANDISDGGVTRSRHWESCFSHQFSYAGGSPHRGSIKGRYRHWISHKLSTWWEQFGTAGCVGCGRCITWCPAGIDITEEVAAIAGKPLPTQGIGGPA